MFGKKTKKSRFACFFLVSLMTAGFLLDSSCAWAEPRHKSRDKDMRWDRGDRRWDGDRGRVVHKLPRGTRTLWVGRDRYRHYRGRFYKPAGTGFVSVGAPFGSVVLSLPGSYTRVFVRGVSYYRCDGIYYKRVPSGYMIVESPPKVVVVRDATPVLIGEGREHGVPVMVTERVLNVRSGPGTGYDVIHLVRRGDLLEVEESTPGWLYVRLPGGEFGWVMAAHTTWSCEGAAG